MAVSLGPVLVGLAAVCAGAGAALTSTSGLTAD
jgi:hypothetical protein